MAKETTKKRIIKKAPTVREQTTRERPKVSTKPRRRVQQRTKAALKPFAVAARFTGRIFRPLAKSSAGRIVSKILRPLKPTFLVNAWKELRQVTWPSRKETVKLTFAVFIFALVFGLLVAVIDYGLDKIFKEVLLND